MNIFFDLDGTLIDSRLRLYSLFQQLVPQSKFSFDEYWNLKRNKINHATILKQYFKFQENEINMFETIWQKLIEEEDLLMLDKPFEGVTEYLISLKNRGFFLHLVTSRQFEINVFLQIIDFGWSNIFNHVLVSQQKAEKEELIKSIMVENTTGSMIGDTGKDIVTGKLLGLKTVAVLSGFLNKPTLSTYNPDIIVDFVTDYIPL